MDLSAGRRMKYFHKMRRIPAECAQVQKNIFNPKNSNIDFYLHKYSQIQGCKAIKDMTQMKTKKSVWT